MSRLIALCLAFVICALPAASHETRPAVADLIVTQDRATLRITMALEAPLSGIDLEGLENTDDAPGAEAYDTLRALDGDALAERLRIGWTGFSDLLQLETDGTRLPLILQQTDVPSLVDADLPRDSVITLTAQLPQGDSPVVFSWDRTLGDVILRHETDAPDAYAAILSAGEASAPIPRDGSSQPEPATDTAISYVIEGFEHILPKGLDHILFVLGLFFLSASMRPLLIQVTAFTAAHTITLALATYGVVSVPSSIVEPLIALSIAYIAVENILVGRVTWRRTLVVFCFGLLHGLGFASVLAVLGLSPGQAALSLIAFNVGVELGQLTVIVAAFLLLALPFRHKPWYRARIAIPMSAIIGLVGLYWFIERIWPFAA